MSLLTATILARKAAAERGEMVYVVANPLNGGYCFGAEQDALVRVYPGGRVVALTVQIGRQLKAEQEAR